MVAPEDQLAIAVEDEFEQGGAGGFLLKYPLNQVKELSGELRCLKTSSLPHTVPVMGSMCTSRTPHTG